MASIRRTELWLFGVVAAVSVAGVRLMPQQSQQPSTVTGRVVDSSTGVGIGGATVTVHLSASRTSRAVETDPSGGFVISDAAPGVYQVTATHVEYGEGGYGQMWPDGPLRLLRLSGGVPTQPIIVRLARRAAIAGTLRTSDGGPLSGVTLRLIPRSAVPTARLAPALTAVTAEDGAYRFLQIPPGKYVLGTIQAYQTTCDSAAVASSCRQRPRDDSLKPVTLPNGDTRVYESTFFPGVNTIAQAEVIWLHSGDARSAVDFSAPLISGVRLGGIVRSTNGPLQNVLVRARRADNISLPQTISIADATTATDKDGRFTLLGVAAGDYIVRAEYSASERTRGPAIVAGPFGPVGTLSGRIAPISESNPLLEASLRLSVGSVDISTLDLSLAPAPYLKGMVQFVGDRKRPSPQDLLARSAMVRPEDGRAPSARAPLDVNGEFSFPSLAASRYFVSADPFPGWTLDAIEAFGQRLGERPIDLRYQGAEGVVIRLTDRAPSISGRVLNAAGHIETNAVVYVFPESAWLFDHSSDQLLAIGVSDSGEFTAGPLRPGPYLVVAVTDAWFDLDWREPDVLQRLSEHAVRIQVRNQHVSGLDLRSQALR
jgi:Carboxypeptidase regulatory-like domain